MRYLRGALLEYCANDVDTLGADACLAVDADPGFCAGIRHRTIREHYPSRVDRRCKTIIPNGAVTSKWSEWRPNRDVSGHGLFPVLRARIERRRSPCVKESAQMLYRL